MKKIIFYISCFAICLFFIIAAGTGCREKDYSSSRGQGFSVSIGFYQFDDPDALQNFSSQVKNWFIQRGFIETEHNLGWTEPGVNLYLRTGLDNERSIFERYNKSVYVSIPYHNDLKNNHYISVSAKWEGPNKEVDNFCDDFNNLINSFKKEFPPGKYLATEKE